jgi:hypothetical protein
MFQKDDGLPEKLGDVVGAIIVVFVFLVLGWAMIRPVMYTEFLRSLLAG